MEERARFTGSIVGLAIGDALGHPTELLSMRAIHERYGARGVTGFEPSGVHPAGTFTDDTQMTIGVARALVRTGGSDLEHTMNVLADELVAWAGSAANDRAPGRTCLRGCRALRDGVQWRQAGVTDSKGCGAAMRAAPIGLFFHDDLDRLVLYAAAQSALTHLHPTAIASSVAAAAAVAHVLAHGLLGLVEAARAATERVTRALLVEVGCLPELAASIGNAEMLAALDRTCAALHSEAEDVCTLLGGAWVGEEAVAAALWCVLRSQRFDDAVLRGANSSGDSDSIACIAGSIYGAHLGLEALPEAWRGGVEQPALLVGLADALLEARSGHTTPTMPQLDPFGAERRASPA